MARIYLHCVLLACGVISLHSQEITGSISGEIRDSTGAVMPGVRVTVRNMETNVAKTVLTGPSGTYRVPFIIFGRYSVSAESPGFKSNARRERPGLHKRGGPRRPCAFRGGGE